LLQVRLVVHAACDFGVFDFKPFILWRKMLLGNLNGLLAGRTSNKFFISVPFFIFKKKFIENTKKKKKKKTSHNNRFHISVPYFILVSFFIHPHFLFKEKEKKKKLRSKRGREAHSITLYSSNTKSETHFF
jgi:hypothetical protein